MTAKRYDVIDEEEPRGQSVTYDGIPCTARTCVTRLNILTEENEQLKHRLSISEKANFVTALEEENERLKSENEKLNERIDILEWCLIDK